jgi:hypothetical protein
MRIPAAFLFGIAACGGGSSNNGLPPADDGGMPTIDGAVGAVALATFDGAAVGLVVDGDALYIGVSQAPKSRILRVPASGGAPTELATDAAMSSSIAVDDTYVYWGNRSGHEVRRVPKAGGAATALAKLVDARPVYVSVDEGNVYVQTESLDSVLTFKKDGTAGPTFNGSAGVQPCGMATDATTLYICSTGGLYAAPKSGGARAAIYRAGAGTEKPLQGFAVDGASVFLSVRVDPCLRKGILLIPSAGASPQELAASCGTNHLVATGGVLYWSASASGLTSLAATGGKPTTYDAEAVGPLAIDETHVYFTRRDEASTTTTLLRARR